MNFTRKGIENFSAYVLPIGTEFVLGKRRWRLESKMSEHPDWQTWIEVSVGANTPPRVFNPSEIEHLFNLGITFNVPLHANHVLAD